MCLIIQNFVLKGVNDARETAHLPGFRLLSGRCVTTLECGSLVKRAIGVGAQSQKGRESFRDEGYRWRGALLHSPLAVKVVCVVFKRMDRRLSCL